MKRLKLLYFPKQPPPQGVGPLPKKNSGSYQFAPHKASNSPQTLLAISVRRHASDLKNLLEDWVHHLINVQEKEAETKPKPTPMALLQRWASVGLGRSKCVVVVDYLFSLPRGGVDMSWEPSKRAGYCIAWSFHCLSCFHCAFPKNIFRKVPSDFSTTRRTTTQMKNAHT